MRVRTLHWLMVIASVLLLGCGDSGDQVGLPNPASRYCVEQGGQVDIVQEPDGERGICVWSNGFACDEWDLYRGDCDPPGDGS